MTRNQAGLIPVPLPSGRDDKLASLFILKIVNANFIAILFFNHHVWFDDNTTVIKHILDICL
jgi:hypothetical protein